MPFLVIRNGAVYINYGTGEQRLGEIADQNREVMQVVDDEGNIVGQVIGDVFTGDATGPMFVTEEEREERNFLNDIYYSSEEAIPFVPDVVFRPALDFMVFTDTLEYRARVERRLNMYEDAASWTNRMLRDQDSLRTRTSEVAQLIPELQGMPPIIPLISPPELADFDGAYFSYLSEFPRTSQLIRTNIVIFNLRLIAVDNLPYNMVIAHELFHYASGARGGGITLRWQNEEGQEHSSSLILHEGITNLFAIQLTEYSGQNPSPFYSVAILIAFFLQRLAGEDTLRSAYMSGDFTEVRYRVNHGLGQGVFENFVEQVEGEIQYMGRANATLQFLINAMDLAETPVDYTSWIVDDPLMSEFVIHNRSAF